MNELKNKRYKIFLLVLMLVIFLSLGIMVKGSNEGIFFDIVVLEYIHNNISPFILIIMKFMSFIGSAYFIIPIMAIILAYNYKNKKYYQSKLLLLATAGSWILNYILKQVFGRIRPLDYFLVDQGGFSYPSGHTMVATTFYFTIAYLLARRIEDKGKKKTYFLLAAIAIFFMGLSRVYLGVHWPTDILGGFLMGYISYYLSVLLVKE